jgi:Spy/CpxP family protein refolding chaperone
MRKALAVAGVVALALGLGAAAGGQPGPEGPRGARMGPDHGMARFLGLSEEQKAQVQKLMEGQRTKHEALREEFEKNRQQLEQALQGANPDPTTVGELAIAGHRLRERGKALREAQDRAIRALLTPEQQAKFDAMRALREDGGPMGWGRPMGRHGMPPIGDEGPRP